VIGRVGALVATAIAAATIALTPRSVVAAPDLAGSVSVDGLVSILVLGDSYSAGNGAGGYYGDAGCWRSAYNYARQFQRIIERPPYNQHAFVENRACSGAVTADYFHSKSGRPPEQNWIDQGYDLILLTFGGNDIYFKDIVKYCLIQASRDGANCEPNLDRAERMTSDGTLKARLTSVLEDIHRRAHPSAKVVLLGYPYLETDTSYRIRSGHGGHFIEVGRRLVNLSDTGDRIQADVVATVNAEFGTQQFVFEKTKDLFHGHELDAMKSVPDRWFIQPWTDSGLAWSDWWYHPNPTGWAKEAELLASDPRVPKSDLNGSGSILAAHKVDVVLTIDATGSMEDDIDAVRSSTTSLVRQLSTNGADWRVAIVTYRDRPPQGEAGDYPSRLELPFSNDVAKVTNAIASIEVGGGGDDQETMLSGIELATRQPWRAGAKKAIVVLGDAAPHDPEAGSGLTSDAIIKASLAVDPAEIYPVDIAPSSDLVTASQALAAGTGGKVVQASDASTVVGVLGTVLNHVALSPIANAGGPYSGSVGRSIPFSGSASIDPDGTIAMYQWDFDGDGSYDETLRSPLTEHAYTAPFDGTVSLRVTDDAGSATVAQTTVHITPVRDFSAPKPHREDDPADFSRDSGRGVRIALLLSIIGAILVGVLAMIAVLRRRREAKPRAARWCDQCGAAVPGGAQRCSSCGWERGARLELRVLSGPSTGRVLVVAPGEVIGRGTDAEQVLVDETVSRRHAQVAWMEGRWAIVDLGSTSGTLRNGMAVERASLALGDRLRLGDTELVVGSVVKDVDPSTSLRT
jgi:Mg-chelatase subunit ChlD